MVSFILELNSRINRTRHSLDEPHNQCECCAITAASFCKAIPGWLELCSAVAPPQPTIRPIGGAYRTSSKNFHITWSKEKKNPESVKTSRIADRSCHDETELRQQDSPTPRGDYSRSLGSIVDQLTLFCDWRGYKFAGKRILELNQA
jgi:hypothetical protein